MDRVKLLTQLTIDEDKRSKPYRDTKGILTIGIGRNLDDVGLSDDEIVYLANNDIARVEKALDANLPWWRTLDDVRQRVLANMCFNMGIGKLLGFKNFLVAVQAKDWTKAVAEMKNSAWFKQVGQRAVRLASMMESGNDPSSR